MPVNNFSHIMTQLKFIAESTHKIGIFSKGKFIENVNTSNITKNPITIWLFDLF